MVAEKSPMDSIEWDLRSPQEDEFALCVSCFKSPCMGWVFPRRRERFEKYLTMREVAAEEIAAWLAAFGRLLGKLTLKYRRPLVLKSPPHTGRIRLLLELFPGARFVHIHRDPYVVFQSSRRTFEIIFRWHCLQRPRRGRPGWQERAPSPGFVLSSPPSRPVSRREDASARCQGPGRRSRRLRCDALA
jgi:hypothetical protein